MNKTFDSPAPFSEFEKVQVPICVWLCDGRNNPAVLMEFFVLSVEMWLKNSIKRIIDYDCQVFSFLFFLPLTP